MAPLWKWQTIQISGLSQLIRPNNADLDKGKIVNFYSKWLSACFRLCVNKLNIVHIDFICIII